MTISALLRVKFESLWRLGYFVKWKYTFVALQSSQKSERQTRVMQFVDTDLEPYTLSRYSYNHRWPLRVPCHKSNTYWEMFLIYTLSCIDRSLCSITTKIALYIHVYQASRDVVGMLTYYCRGIQRSCRVIIRLYFLSYRTLFTCIKTYVKLHMHWFYVFCPCCMLNDLRDFSHTLRLPYAVSLAWNRDASNITHHQRLSSERVEIVIYAVNADSGCTLETTMWTHLYKDLKRQTNVDIRFVLHKYTKSWFAPIDSFVYIWCTR